MLEETGDEEGVRSTAGITYSGGFDTVGIHWSGVSPMR